MKVRTIIKAVAVSLPLTLTALASSQTDAFSSLHKSSALEDSETIITVPRNGATGEYSSAYRGTHNDLEIGRVSKKHSSNRCTTKNDRKSIEEERFNQLISGYYKSDPQ